MKKSKKDRTAVSTTYATAKLTQTRSAHKLSGSEQLNPFGRSLKGAVAQNEPNNKAVSSGHLSQNSTAQFNCKLGLKVQDPKILQIKNSNNLELRHKDNMNR